jgi:hypothetical protein
MHGNKHRATLANFSIGTSLVLGPTHSVFLLLYRITDCKPELKVRRVGKNLSYNTSVLGIGGRREG